MANRSEVESIFKVLVSRLPELRDGARYELDVYAPDGVPRFRIVVVSPEGGEHVCFGGRYWLGYEEAARGLNDMIRAFDGAEEARRKFGRESR